MTPFKSHVIHTCFGEAALGSNPIADRNEVHGFNCRMIYISGKSKKKITISLFSGIWGIQKFGKILQTWSRISGFPTRHSTDFTGTKPQNGEVATKVATDTEPTHIELRCLCKCETSKRIETSFHTSLDGKLAVYCHSIYFHYLIREIEPGKIDKCRSANRLSTQCDMNVVWF
ncbi:hypothetical protein CIRG_00338 [Coccidioides immitis RMSCC 2394]|uniref:Uncharacterized protein n=1 Tax=Coccidioides immitis RMSCC 2394 TaxID=404692 RepID=A0A0J6XVJ0_COCIT|nr:hypothetical protein CIRG_00338 [Coccidioides immitis RMSCC 2394]